MKKVLFAASESLPFVKTGGLGDVLGSLPKYFPKKVVDARVVLPLYDMIDEKYKKKIKKIADYKVGFKWNDVDCSLYELKHEKVTFYFVKGEGFFGGDVPYEGGTEDLEKFAFFSRALLLGIKAIDYKPDVIHCNDWQVGPVPPLVKEFAKGDEFFKNVKTVITIHNLRFQGVYNKAFIQEITGLPDEYMADEGLGYYDNGNFLKGGIAYADFVTTVSETYASEIMNPFYGEGLDGLLNYRAEELKGIINGIDYDAFNPETDPLIKKNYTVETFRKDKYKNKIALQKELGLIEDKKVMMIGIISRLTDQKGMDLIAYMMDELCQDAVQIVVLGTGEEKYESMFKHYAWKYEGRVSANIMYDEKLSHKIYAACDAFLMPSLFEPCGLSQMMAMRYGTLPIVRETGGLKDTVNPYNEYEHTGCGFSFANYNAHEMLGTIRYAQRAFYDIKRDWNKMCENAMNMDYSWNASARRYIELYEMLTQPLEEC